MTLKVATHSGPYHTDDVFALAILELVHGEVEVVRTRDEEVMKTCDMRVDVGGKYNPETGDYDHHQKEGAGIRENEIPYAACGLVWKHFGQKLCDDDVWERIDEKLIQGIDADDTGVDTFTVEKVPPYTIQGILASFRPTWQEESDFDAAFLKCVKLAKELLSNEIKQAKAKLEASKYVQECVENNTHEQYIVLEKYCPWKKIIVDETELLYVVYPSSQNSWMVQAVNKTKDTFENRKDLPESWRGLRDEELAKVTGVSDAIFCHNGLFLAVTKTKEGAIALVELALKN